MILKIVCYYCSIEAAKWWFHFVMSEEKVKTIRFSVKTDEKLQAIALKCGLTKLDFFRYMVEYFYRSKKDPRDLSDELLKTELQKKTNSIISIIRAQEQDLFIPVKKDTEKLLATSVKLVELISHVVKHNQEQRDACQNQIRGIGWLVESFKKTDRARYETALLKSRFQELMEYYIKARDQLGVLSKQADKDSLNKHIREQVKNL
nr:BfmA/BtgA family mobilization protein [Hufsiella arboris]